MTGGGCWISRCPAVFPLSLFQPQNTDSAHMRSTKSCRYNAQPRPRPLGDRGVINAIKHTERQGVWCRQRLCVNCLALMFLSSLTSDKCWGTRGKRVDLNQDVVWVLFLTPPPSSPAPPSCPQQEVKKVIDGWFRRKPVCAADPPDSSIFILSFIYFLQLRRFPPLFSCWFFFCFVSTLSGSFFYHC